MCRSLLHRSLCGRQESLRSCIQGSRQSLNHGIFALEILGSLTQFVIFLHVWWIHLLIYSFIFLEFCCCWPTSVVVEMWIFTRQVNSPRFMHNNSRMAPNSWTRNSHEMNFAHLFIYLLNKLFENCDIIEVLCSAYLWKSVTKDDSYWYCKIGQDNTKCKYDKDISAI